MLPMKINVATLKIARVLRNNHPDDMDLIEMMEFSLGAAIRCEEKGVNWEVEIHFKDSLLYEVAMTLEIEGGDG